MVHSYSHTSPHPPEDNNARRLLYAFGVTTGLILVEVVGGFLSDSLALLTDVGHMLADTATLLFALLAVQFLRRPPTIRHTFGWLRPTTLTMFTNTVAPIVVTILIVWGAVERFRTPRPVGGGMIMTITVARLLANMLSFWLFHHGSEKKNLNVRAVALHVLGDLLGSVGTIIAVSTIIWTGWTPADPILSMLVSLLILRSVWWLLKDSVNELLEGTPVSLDIAGLKRRMCREIPEARNVHHVHVWMVGEKSVMTLRVQVVPPHNYDVLLDQIQCYLVGHYQIEHVTIQMEYQPCHGSNRHLNEGVSGYSHHHH